MKVTKIIFSIFFALIISGLNIKPVLADHRFQLWFMPPANRQDSSNHRDEAKKIQQWHASSLSGDGSRSYSCSPGAYGTATCSALDWTDENAAAGDWAYLRFYSADINAAAYDTTKVKIKSNYYTSSGCDVNRVDIYHVKTGERNQKVGTMYYQHITRHTNWNNPYLPRIGFGTTFSLTNKVLGRMTNDSDCYNSTVGHVHEDDGRYGKFKAWNTNRYDSSAEAFFEVDARLNNWTRKLLFGAH